MTAYEASSLDLEGTDLVVLSACETGLGGIKSGEGVMGMRRSFQLAGAANVMSSMWEVPAGSTMNIMNNFYRAWLKDKQSKSEALRSAQISELRRLREHPAYYETPNPLEWGAFVLYGKP